MKKGCMLAFLFIAGYLFLPWIVIGVASYYDEDFSVPVVFTVIWVVLGIWLFARTVTTIRRWRTQEQKSAAEVLALDKRPPVVYLRAFKEDDTGKPPSTADLMGLLVQGFPVTFRAAATYEEGLMRTLQKVGPVVALGSYKQLGAARLHSDDASWRDAVEELLQKCSLVVLRAGDTESLLWELRQVVSRVPPQKVIVYLQMGSETDLAVQQARYHRFRRASADVFPRPLPESLGRHQFLYFGSDWTPVFARDLKHILINNRLLS